MIEPTSVEPVIDEPVPEPQPQQQPDVTEELIIDELSIDGMCGVY